MKEFFEKLFASNGFIPHGHSYFWEPSILWTNVIADGLIAAAYFAIPLCLAVIAKKRHDIAFRWLLVLFGIFIYSCGTTHIFSMITVWIPVYRLDAIIKVITAIFSVSTAFALIKFTPKALAIPTIQQWEKVNQELKEQIRQLQEKDKSLQESAQALKESEDRYNNLRDIFDSVVIHADLVIAYANPSAATMLGASSTEDLVGRSILDFIKPERKEFIQRRVMQVNNGEKIQLIEQKLLRLDGDEVDVETVSVPFLYKGKKAVQTIVRAITERKQNENMLRESEAKFRHLFELDMLGMLFSDYENTITDANDAFLNMIGYNHDDIQNKKLQWTALTPAGYEKEDEKAIHELMTKGTSVPYEKEYIRKDGTRVSILVGAALLADTKSVVAFILDITERKRQEKILQQSEAKFRGVFESDMIGIVFVDFNDTIVEANDAFLQIVDYSREEQQQGLIRWRDMTPAQYTELDNKGWYEIKMKGLMTPYEKEFIRKDGSRVSVLLGGSLLAGHTDVVVSFVLDITSLKNTQHELEQHALDLARSNEELEQFAYIASHDLQEPLRTMAGFANLLEKKYKHKLDEDAVEFIGFIIDASERMKKLITNLLEFSRINSKNAPFTAVDFGTVINKVITTSQNRIRENNIHIHYGPMPVLPADATQMAQLFGHLIGNAMKFRDERPLKIDIQATEQEKDWLFAVADTGIGIDMAYSTRIFQVFQRLHSRDKYEGTGIGLAVCKKIVQRHGGNIWVESQLGEGSVFYFTIKK